jgi:hypothetical protein
VERYYKVKVNVRYELSVLAESPEDSEHQASDAPFEDWEYLWSSDFEVEPEEDTSEDPNPA